VLGVLMTETIPVEGDDEEMIAAIGEARRRLPEFRGTLEDDWRRKIPIIDRPLVKAQFRSSLAGKIEHMWVEVTNFEDGVIVGELANEPNEIPELSQGQEVHVSTDDISDWVYWQGDLTIGGFTLAVLERREQSAASNERTDEGDTACNPAT
jgi:uncharacterized protein YegJ (DUF2314 family)